MTLDSPPSSNHPLDWKALEGCFWMFFFLVGGASSVMWPSGVTLKEMQMSCCAFFFLNVIMIVIIDVVWLTAEWRLWICGEERFCLAQPQQCVFPARDVVACIGVKQLGHDCNNILYNLWSKKGFYAKTQTYWQTNQYLNYFLPKTIQFISTVWILSICKNASHTIIKCNTMTVIFHKYSNFDCFRYVFVPVIIIGWMFIYFVNIHFIILQVQVIQVVLVTINIGLPI